MGYGKGGKLKDAFHFPTTPTAATSIELAEFQFVPAGVRALPGAEAPILLWAFSGAAEAVPF
jgi:hypothetical protein